MAFELPQELPTSTEDLQALLTAAEAEIDELGSAVKEEGTLVSEETLTRLQYLHESADKLYAAVDEIKAAEAERTEKARAILDAAAARRPKPEADEANEDVVAEAEKIAADAADKEPALTASDKPKPDFGKLAGRRPTGGVPKGEVGFLMAPGAYGAQENPGLVNFSTLGRVLDKMAPGTTIPRNRAPHRSAPHKVAMSLATLDRGFVDSQRVETPEQLEASIKDQTLAQNWQGAKFNSEGAMTASAGWCAPTERTYDFCEVPPVADLLSLPEVNSTRGGISWPEEPDFSALLAALDVFDYTEAELIANDANPAWEGKPCVEIPCVAFEEVRPEAIGVCVTSGILQKRGFPELIANFLQKTTKAHLRRISRKSITTMVAGSGAPIVIPAGSTIGAAGSVLNSLAFMAVQLRLVDDLPSDAWVEGVAPTWTRDVMRADLAYLADKQWFEVSDQMINDWLTARRIRLQYVSDWQTRGVGEPGHLTGGVPDVLAWGATVDVLLYRPGAWFRHLANVIEVGTMYDLGQLKKNKQTELFTEDEIFVAKRCGTSWNIRIPICVSGGIGDRERVTCNATVENPA